jgi:hypothetical protein
MVTAHITLTDEQNAALRAIAQQIGKSPDEVIYEAVERFILQSKMAYRGALLQQARGMWQDRTDLPEPEALRAELAWRML